MTATKFSPIPLGNRFVIVEATYRRRHPVTDANKSGEISCPICGETIECTLELVQDGFLGTCLVWSVFPCLECSHAIVYVYTIESEYGSAESTI